MAYYLASLWLQLWQACSDIEYKEARVDADVNACFNASQYIYIYIYLSLSV